MIVKKLTKFEFVPQKIEITIESEDELCALLLKLNLSPFLLKDVYEKLSNPKYTIRETKHHATFELWNLLDKMRKDMDIEDPYTRIIDQE